MWKAYLARVAAAEKAAEESDEEMEESEETPEAEEVMDHEEEIMEAPVWNKRAEPVKAKREKAGVSKSQTLSRAEQKVYREVFDTMDLEGKVGTEKFALKYLKKLPKNSEGLDKEVFLTLVAIAILEECFDERRDEWRMAMKKSIRFLRANGIDSPEVHIEGLIPRLEFK